MNLVRQVAAVREMVEKGAGAGASAAQDTRDTTQVRRGSNHPF